MSAMIDAGPRLPEPIYAPQTAAPASAELSRFDIHDEGYESRNNNIQQRGLEPADGGLAAWKVLFAAFMFEALLWGFPLSYGVFQNYYTQHTDFADSPYISVVGPVSTGIVFLGSPIMTPIVKRYSAYQPQMIWVGWPLCILGLVAGSFATNITALILTQGVMYGCGYLIFYYPLINIVNDWWITRRGMAFGILCSSSGFTGVVMPFTVEALLNKYGYRTTLRAMAIAFALLTGPFLLLFKTRLPAAQQHRYHRTDWSFVRKPLFHIYNISNILQGLGYYFPSLFIPSYAASIGLSPTQGALLLALMSVAQVLGQFTFGYLSDGNLSVNFLIISSAGMSAISVFTLWGLSHSIGPLVAFVLVYGFFGAGYVSMWPRMGNEISNESTAVLANFGIFCFGKGLGNVLTGPISLGLLSKTTILHDYAVSRYKGLVLFTGICMLLSACSVSFWQLKQLKSRTI